MGQLTPQQQNLVQAVRETPNNLVVEALAGTGKTFSIIRSCMEIPNQRVIILAFNKSIASEVEQKVRGLPHVEAKTFHALGTRAIMKDRLPKGIDVEIDAKGVKRRQMQIAIDCPPSLTGPVSALVSIAKQGLMNTEDELLEAIKHYSILDKAPIWARQNFDASTVDDCIRLALDGLKWSRECLHLIDFDDMLYMPAFERLPLSGYDVAFIDEAQDTNAARRYIGGAAAERTVWVGDRRQAIYGFTGADSDALDRIAEEYKCDIYPLTVSFRVSKEASKAARKLVKEFECHPSNEEGSISRISYDEMLLDVCSEDVVLCRNTAPLVRAAIDLLSADKPCYIVGRDFSANLLGLIDLFDVSTVPELAKSLIDYQNLEIARLLALEDSEGIRSLQDRVSAISSIMSGRSTVEEVRNVIVDVFNGSTGVELSTIHRAKGKEWERVYVLGYHELQPGSHAKLPWQIEQEYNLMYVAVTRTLKDLIFVSLAQ